MPREQRDEREESISPERTFADSETFRFVSRTRKARLRQYQTFENSFYKVTKHFPLAANALTQSLILHQTFTCKPSCETLCFSTGMNHKFTSLVDPLTNARISKSSWIFNFLAIFGPSSNFPPRSQSRKSRGVPRPTVCHECVIIEREMFDVVCANRWVYATMLRKFHEEELPDRRAMKIFLFDVSFQSNNFRRALVNAS